MRECVSRTRAIVNESKGMGGVRVTVKYGDGEGK